MTVILLLSVYHRMPDIPRGKLIVKESGLFSGREVIDILFEPAVEQLSVDWNVEEGSEIKAGDEIFNFEGSGAEILKVHRLVEWIIGRMSGIATSARCVVEALEKSGKRLIAGSTVSPIFEAFDEIAFTTAGGVFKRHGLSDSIYVTKNHLSYAGGISDIIERVDKELGEVRKTVKIEVEVNSFDEFVIANDQDCEVIHLVGLNEIQIRDVFEGYSARRHIALRSLSFNGHFGINSIETGDDIKNESQLNLPSAEREFDRLCRRDSPGIYQQGRGID